MGYSTDFEGDIGIEPPLSLKEVNFLNKFSDSRRVHRENGPYCCDDNVSDVIDHNQPPQGQPGLWCQWVPDESGSAIIWDGNEKFYCAGEWMVYVIEHFLKENPLAKAENPEEFEFLQGHTLNGEICAQGDESDDRWQIEVKDNVVTIVKS